MVGAAPSQRNLRFGPYVADLSTGELWRDGVKVSLQDKPFQILALLLVAAEGPAVETAAGAAAPFTPEPAAASAPVRPRPQWPLHAAWLVVALLAAAVAWRVRGSERLPDRPVANQVPVLVLMDSPLPGRVYDPRTLAAGGTNADDLTDALRDLPVVIEKENTSPMWHREQQVLLQNPDLIVSHLSCLYDQRVAPQGDPVRQQFFNVAVDRLLAFFAYVARSNLRTRFLVYSRGRFAEYGGEEKFRTDTEARFPVLAGRLHPWTVPGDPEKVTFRDPALARLIRERVQAILAPP